MECKFLSKCPFFNGKMATKLSLLNMYKKSYCLGNNSECARYIIATKLGKEYVSNDLYPNTGMGVVPSICAVRGNLYVNIWFIIVFQNII